MRINSSVIEYMVDCIPTWVQASRVEQYDNYHYSIINTKKTESDDLVLIEWRPTWVREELISKQAIETFQKKQRDRRMYRRELRRDS